MGDERPLLSRYRPSDELFYRETGELVPAIPTVSGVYAPDGGRVRLFTDADDRAGLVFPAEPEWVLDRALPRSFPWPGWHRVDDFDGADALHRFVRLADDRDVLRFALSYGPLWACPEHPAICLWRGLNGPDEAGRRHTWVNAEPVDYWLWLAAFLRALLTAAARWWAGERLRDEDWRGMRLDPPQTVPEIRWAPGGRQERWYEGLVISSMVNGQLQSLGVGLHLSETLQPELNTGLGFLPAIWQQAVAVIGGGRALAVCNACARPYVRLWRAPKTGQRNWCTDCQQARKRRSRRNPASARIDSNADSNGGERGRTLANES
jgi:hypothetical protein